MFFENKCENIYFSQFRMREGFFFLVAESIFHFLFEKKNNNSGDLKKSYIF